MFIKESMISVVLIVIGLLRDPLQSHLSATFEILILRRSSNRCKHSI